MEIINGTKKDLPNATAILVLGILSLIFCWCYGIIGLILGIVTVVMASSQRRLYFSSPQEYTEASLRNVNSGRVCAIIAICFASVVILFWVLLLLGIIAGLSIASFGL